MPYHAPFCVFFGGLNPLKFWITIKPPKGMSPRKKYNQDRTEQDNKKVTEA